MSARGLGFANLRQVHGLPISSVSALLEKLKTGLDFRVGEPGPQIEPKVVCDALGRACIREVRYADLISHSRVSRRGLAACTVVGPLVRASGLTWRSTGARSTLKQVITRKQNRRRQSRTLPVGKLARQAMLHLPLTRPERFWAIPPILAKADYKLVHLS